MKWALNLNHAFGNLSLKKKVVLVIVAPCFLLVILAVTVSSLVEYHLFRNRFMVEHQTVGRMLSINLVSSVLFEDEVDAGEILDSLRSRLSVDMASVYYRKGQVLASFMTNQDLPPFSHEELTQQTQYRNEWLIINESIQYEDQNIGHLVLRVNLEDIDSFIVARFQILLGVLLGTSLVAFILPVLIGNLISEPILELARTADRITHDEDYSHRQSRHFNDETGLLVDAFNAMMDRIEKREAIINANAERFKRYFELGIVGMGVLDANMRWIECNQRMTEILGYDSSELAMLTWQDLLSKEHGDDHKKELFPMLQGKEDRFMGDCWLKSNHQKEVYAMMALRKVSALESNDTQYIVLIQDITERKEYEQKLFQAKETAEASSKAKDEFLSVMSHELRTPLNPIIGFGEMLMLDIKDEDSRRLLDIMMGSAKHLLELIDSILNYIRIQKDVIELAQNRIDIRQIGSEVTQLMQERSSKKDLSLRYYFNALDYPQAPHQNTYLIRGDETRLRQILFNLLSNAIKFTDCGEVCLTIRMGPCKGGIATMRIEVTDTGVGIPKDQLEQIFLPFTQLDATFTREYSGIGLGLAICRRIVQAMDGMIGVDSVLGKGSEFWAEIPVRVDVNLAETRVFKETNPALKPAQNNPRVLLVEDDPSNRELALMILRRDGIIVDTAFDGIEALDLLETHTYDLILMDVQMPRLDGFKATRSIRKMNQDTSKIPIIGVTAHAGMESREKCRRSGMNDCLTKPYTPKQLSEIVAKWTSKEKATT